MLCKTMRNWMVGMLFGVVIGALAVTAAPAAEATTESEAEPGEAEPADPYAVPDGTPAELAKFIEGVLSQQPPNEEARKKAVAALNEAADKIIAGKPNEEQAQIAVEAKLISEKSVEALEALVEKLNKAGLKQAARSATTGVLQRRLDEAVRVGVDTPKQLAKAVEAVKAHLSKGPLDPQDAGLAMKAGRLTERIGDDKLAVETHTALGKILAASNNVRIAEMGAMMQGVARRLGLVGKQMKVEGTLLGGKAFDWASYRGKVVLVDFWATWCGPCLAEIPNLKRLYDAYHDRGFDIVGLSLDDDRERLEGFIEQAEIPWATVYGDEGRSPTIAYYGVMGIPTMILVGKDGKVLSTNAHGEVLNRHLEKLLGPAEVESDKSKESKESK